MNKIHYLIASLAVTASALALAQPAFTDGEVRKLDKAAGKVTLKHGEIKNLNMPGMTMVFLAKDRKLVDKLKVGDKVRFTAIDEAGQLVLTGIEPRK